MPGSNGQPEVVRVVGPAGAGKSLLVVSLMESLRSRGYRTASAERRPDGTTVLAFSHGARVVLDRPVGIDQLPQVAASVDPSVRLVMAEAFEEGGIPAVEVRPAGAAPYPLHEADRFAVIAAEEIAAAFARGGPGQAVGIADRIEREILDVSAEPEAPGVPEVEREVERGFGFGRFLRRFR